MSITRVESWGTTQGGFTVWFCIRTQPKRETVAALTLEKEFGFEVFSPKLRIKKSTLTGTLWISEPLFPSYIFAKFDFFLHKRAVSYAHGVSGIVHFGNYYPRIPEQTIEELRRLVGPEQVYTIADEFCEGDTLLVGDGPFKGLEVVVLKPMPGSKRVMVLMEFLGRQTMVEMEKSSLLKPKNQYREIVFKQRDAGCELMD